MLESPPVFQQAGFSPGVTGTPQRHRGALHSSSGDGSVETDLTGGSCFCPRATIRKASSGSGRCSTSASAGGAAIHVSHSSGVVRITGIALGWIGRALVSSRPSAVFRTIGAA